MKLDIAFGETDAPFQHAWPFAIPASDLRELTDRHPIDVRAYLEHCMGNKAFALTTLDEFTRTAYERMTSLRQVAQNTALPELADMAHALKSVASICAARKLCELCSDLGALASADNLSQSRYLVHSLCDEIRRCLDYVSTIRPELSKH